MSWLEDTRISYDTVAESYQPMVWAGFADIVVERSMLVAFATLVAGAGQVADIGCGPGDITAWLAGHGLDMLGIDLSPGMLTVARRNHPDIEFREGDMTALSLGDGSLEGVVSWWSTVHLPPPTLPSVFAEFARVLMPGGYLLVGFHGVAPGGDSEVRHLTAGYGGHPVTLDVYLRPPATISSAAQAVGLELVAELTVEPQRTVAAQQCCLLLRKPAATVTTELPAELLK